MRDIDILITNGLIFDGTGSQPYEADIGVSGDRIAFIDRTSECGKAEWEMRRKSRADY